MSELIKTINLSKNSEDLNFYKLHDQILKNLNKNKKILSKDEVESLIQLFFINKKYELLAKLLISLFKLEINFNKSHVISLLLVTNNLTPDTNIKPLLDNISLRKSAPLLGFQTKSELLNKFIEKNRLKTFERQRNLKSELLEKFEFFRTQHLEDKAKDTLSELLLSFPEEPSLKKYISNEKEKNYEKIIARTAKKSLKSELNFENDVYDQDSLKMRQTWFKLWQDSFGKENSRLLREQMNFLDFEEDESITYELLKSPKIDVWDKIELLYKVKRYYEGLNLLEELEGETLAKKPEMMYNFYYYKALMLKGAGLEKEALKILEAIIEQNAGFRDVKYLYKKWQ